jgi:hypothetical protein
MSRVVDFFHVLNCVSDENAFINLCKQERENVRSKYNTVQSMKTKFSQYRSYLQNHYYQYNPVLNAAIKNIDLLTKQGNTIDKSTLLTATNFSFSLTELKKYYSQYLTILNYLKIEDFETRKIKEDYNAIVKTRRSNLNYILDVDGYIRKAVDLLQVDSFIDNILGLAALTGRRVAEIACTAQLDYINEFAVSFKGQLKTKDVANDVFIEIPVLVDSHLIINSLSRIQSRYGQYLNNPTKFHNNCSSALSKKSHQFESFVEGKVTPKDLRAIYAAIAFNKHCNNDRMDDTVYYSNILGHDEKDTDTCLSYTKYKIKS